MLKIFRKKETVVSEEGLPRHIAIIMDGNGRWAKQRGLPRNIGHNEGSKAIRRIVEESYRMGIEYLTVYAFSTENWKRPEQEVNALMKLLTDFLSDADKELQGKEVRIRVIGDIQALPEVTRKRIEEVESSTRNHRKMQFVIALNYGGRQELIHAFREIARDVRDGKTLPEDISEERIRGALFTHDIPDPDLIIRTSGEERLSNFLLWQAAYAEFYFTRTLWPDFSAEAFKEAIHHYQSRHRRYGGI